jgi:pilin isopeptide linkage protein
MRIITVRQGHVGWFAERPFSKGSMISCRLRTLIVWILQGRLLGGMFVILLLAACFAIPEQAVSASGNTPVAVFIPAEVVISGDSPGTDTVFHLCMERMTEGIPAPAETTLAVTGAGRVTFGPVQFNAPGDYQYRIFELQENAEHYICDSCVYLVTVRIFSDAQGLLTSEIWMAKQGETAKSASAIFTNHYQNGTGEGTVSGKYPAVIDPLVQKKVSAGSPPAASMFLFVLKADSPICPMPDGSIGGVRTVSIYGTGTGDFGKIVYYSPGIYSYTCYEVNTGIAGYTYDASIFAMKVVVTESDGRLSAIRTVSKEGIPQAETFVFDNVYSGTGISRQKTENNTAKQTSPKTGDDYPYELQVALMMIAVIGAAGTLPHILFARHERRSRS